MAEINRDALQKLAQLSRIECSDAEAESLLHDLKQMLSYVETLQNLDTEGAQACSYVLADQVNVMREDHTGDTLDHNEFLENSPAHIGGMIRVPPVIKKHEA